MALLKSLIALSAAALVSAVPVSTSTSTGFRLVVKVTDPTTDLTPSVEGWQLVGIHTGAGLNDAVINSTSGLVFYQNGKSTDLLRIYAHKHMHIHTYKHSHKWDARVD
jgi:hypothetical protein